jgi:HPt (histidine-containing phosphotransfer) domain-containing protein
LSKLAHRLKPSLGMVGLTDLEKTMAEIENQARKQPEAESLQLLLNHVNAQLEAGVKEIKRKIEKLKL